MVRLLTWRVEPMMWNVMVIMWRRLFKCPVMKKLVFIHSIQRRRNSTEYIGTKDTENNKHATEESLLQWISSRDGTTLEEIISQFSATCKDEILTLLNAMEENFTIYTNKDKYRLI